MDDGGVIEWNSEYKEDEQSGLDSMSPSSGTPRGASDHRLSIDSHRSFTSSTTASSFESSVVTPPLLPAETDGVSVFDCSNASPISAHSSPSSLDEDTPRAEQPAPVWPLSWLHDKARGSRHREKPSERPAAESDQGDTLDESKTRRERPNHNDEEWTNQPFR